MSISVTIIILESGRNRKKERFDSTNLMELPEYHSVAKL